MIERAEMELLKVVGNAVRVAVRRVLGRMRVPTGPVNDAELLIIAKVLKLTPNDLLTASLQNALEVVRQRSEE